MSWDNILPDLSISARAFVSKYASKLTDEEIAKQLTSAGFDATAQSVRSVRRRLGLPKAFTPSESFDSTSQVKSDEQGNHLVLESRDARITSLDQLLDFCKVDLSVWEVERHVLNKWEVGAKSETKDLSFSEGVITGTIESDGKLVIEPLIQIKAWLLRKVPIAITPVIQPVNISLSKAEKKFSVTQTHRALILPDPQFGFRKDFRTGQLDPFHDRLALDVALQIASDYWIDTTIWLGDILDLADWSDKFIRSPEMFFTTQPAVIEAAWWLRAFKEATYSKTYALCGNHDKRMNTALNTHMIQAYDLRAADHLDLPPVLSVPNLLGLDKLGIEYINDYPNGEVWINDQVKCIHGDIARGGSGATVSSLVDDIQETTIQGHNHRVESANKTLHTRQGTRTVAAWSMGCLCRIDGVVPGVKARQNWQQAIGIVEYLDTGEHNVAPIPINNGRAIYNGHIYTARQRIEDLKRETGWAF